MTTSRVDIEIPNAERVSLTDDTLTVELSDGRSVAVPLTWFPRLLHATQAERERWRLVGRGQGIHWEELDEDISVESLIEPAFDLAIEAADFCSPEADRERMMSELAEVALALASNPARRQVALRALSQTATSDEHFAALAAFGGENTDLAWRTLVRKADV